MGQKNKFKYICAECGTERWMSSRDRGSRFSPRCYSCGSTWLDPSDYSRGPDKLATVHSVIKGNIARYKNKTK
jgi:hypothetical protein